MSWAPKRGRWGTTALRDRGEPVCQGRYFGHRWEPYGPGVGLFIDQTCSRCGAERPPGGIGKVPRT
ncbi:MAG TPA: hypothetical protein VGA20_04500 [Gemmatimonadales bacterium]